MQPIKFIYFGTPDFSTYVLDALKEAGYTPSLVVTNPDRPRGRGLALAESPVKQWAVAHGIPLLQPEIYDEETVEKLRNSKADLLIVAAYGKILPKAVLEVGAKGALNVHPSLLPRYRGTSPVESQILASEKNIGVSVILMDEKMDHGSIVAQEEVPLPTRPLSRSILNEHLWKAGGALLAKTLPLFIDGNIVLREQDHAHATFTKKITKEDGELKLEESDEKKYLKYLAYEGWPGTYFFLANNGARIRHKITQASFKGGLFIVEKVIPEGGKEIPYTAL
jgi:methionyl-tRNA formyltransferase